MSDFLRLLEILETEMELYGKLYTLLEKDSEFITEFNRESLSINNSKKEHILKKLTRMNEKREFYVLELSKNYEQNKKLTLKQLVQFAPEDLKDRFEKCHRDFVALVRSVKEKNFYNKEYITLSLKRLRAITNNLNKYLNIESTYNQKGKVSDQRLSSVMTKEA